MSWRLLALPLLLAASDAPGDPFDSAVDALAAGSAAFHRHDDTRLRRALAALRASGATPLDRSDPVGGWSRGGRTAPAPPYRDRVLGPGYRAITLQGDGVWRVEQTFLAGQRARIAVVSAAPKSFTMQVTDDDRATVCRASPAHHQCDWVPAYTARFSIEVRNPGPGSGRYFIVMQ